MLKLFIFFALFAFSLLCHAQNNGSFVNNGALEKAKDEVVVTNQEQLDNEINSNEFDHLFSADRVVYQLRKNYGIQGSVILTKTLWQILTSYSNQQQAQNIWQTAINNATNIEKNSLVTTVNLQFSTAQIISKYTHGMDLKKWNENRIGIDINKNNLNDFLALNDDLTIYLHLNKAWEVIIVDIMHQENILWNDVFLGSIDLFAELEDPSLELDLSLGKLNSIDQEENLNHLFFQYYSTWESQEKQEFALADLVQYLLKTKQLNNHLFQAAIRFSLNKKHAHYLAASLAWFEVAYGLEKHFNNNAEINESELQAIDALIEHSDTWFLSHEQQLKTVDETLPTQIETSIHNLKAFFRGEQHTQSALNNAPTAFDLVEPAFNKYMATPFRKTIHKNLEVCFNISDELADYPPLPISLNQFNGCVNDLTQVAINEALTRRMSGSLVKIDSNIQALDRALKLPPWQTINILYANSARPNCLVDSDQMVNSIEWIYAAESLLWFADRWPAYFKHVQPQQLVGIIKQGEKLDSGFGCLDKPKNEILDDQFNHIIQAWQSVKVQLKELAMEFNKINLAPESDLDLLENVEKLSNYRVKDAQINACDAQLSCGVHVSLDSSRALYGLFPQHLLVANQLKQGDLKLCYDNVGWENRRSASTHLDNDNVANYYANFSFSIKGFFQDELVFERKITSSEEHLYLFAENKPEVLSTYCPLERVGEKISTKLERGTYGLVPNRLTFLTASRANESKILANNWSNGQEWRDKLTGNEVVLVYENNLDEHKENVQRSYQQRATQLQDQIYQSLLGYSIKSSEAQAQLKVAFAHMKRMTQLFSHLLYIMQPDDLMSADSVHGILFGSEKIPNTNSLIKYHDNQLNIKQLILAIDEIMKLNQNKWNNFSANGSNAYLHSILYRLKTITHR